MLAMLARPGGVFFVVTGCAFAGCGLQTEGLGPSTSTSSVVSSSTGTSASHAAGTGGHGGASTSTSSSVGTGGAGTEDAGGTDAGIDAAPVDSGPPLYASCKDWLAALPGAASGVYRLVDPMGNVYEAYCDMVGEIGDTGDAGDAGDAGDMAVGGGWTLVLKIDGNQNTFPYDNPLWTNLSAYNAESPALDTNEAKLESFWTVPFMALRVGMIDPNNHVLRWLVVPVASTSLLDLVNAGGTTTTLGKAEWESLLLTGSIQTNCNWEGINADGHVRIGIVGDDSNPECNTPDSFIGFGADTWFASPFDCGNIAHWYPDHGDQTTKAFGYVMVR